MNKAVITHSHGDHARSGHHHLIAHHHTVGIMRIRYGQDCALCVQSLDYQQPIYLNGVNVYLLPAGHILGSAQIVMDYGDARVIVSGDYKRAYDPTCAGFVVEPCHTFITEATFGLPVFKHPAIADEINKLLRSLQTYPERCHLVGVYALGKCQRLIKTLRMLGYLQPIYLHGALQKLCDFYESTGIALGHLLPASELTKTSSQGKIVLCPPSALHDRWSRRFANPVVAMASGWMQIKARAKQKGVELPLIISDHADWPELLQTITDINPQEVWVTHGREDALVYYANKLGYRTQGLRLLGFEDEEDS